MRMFQMKRTVKLSSSLEFGWGYWICLLAPPHSYILLVFYSIRRCSVLCIYMYVCVCVIHNVALMGLDVY